MRSYKYSRSYRKAVTVSTNGILAAPPPLFFCVRVFGGWGGDGGAKNIGTNSLHKMCDHQGKAFFLHVT
jgi:hypothetical protein